MIYIKQKKEGRGNTAFFHLSLSHSSLHFPSQFHQLRASLHFSLYSPPLHHLPHSHLSRPPATSSHGNAPAQPAYTATSSTSLTGTSGSNSVQLCRCFPAQRSRPALPRPTTSSPAVLSSSSSPASSISPASFARPLPLPRASSNPQASPRCFPTRPASHSSSVRSPPAASARPADSPSPARPVAAATALGDFTSLSSIFSHFSLHYCTLLFPQVKPPHSILVHHHLLQPRAPTRPLSSHFRAFHVQQVSSPQQFCPSLRQLFLRQFPHARPQLIPALHSACTPQQLLQYFNVSSTFTSSRLPFIRSPLVQQLRPSCASSAAPVQSPCTLAPFLQLPHVPGARPPCPQSSTAAKRRKAKMSFWAYIWVLILGLDM